MNVWTSGGPGDRTTKSEVRNSVLLQIVEQRTSLDTIRMKLYVHRVAMIQTPAIVNRALPKDGDGKLFLERV